MRKICKWLTNKVLCGSLIIVLTIPPVIIGFLWWGKDVRLFSRNWFEGMSVILFLLIIWFVAFIYAERHNLTKAKGNNIPKRL